MEASGLLRRNNGVGRRCRIIAGVGYATPRASPARVLPVASQSDRVSMNDSMRALKNLLPVSAWVAGKLDFVAAPIWRRTRTLCIVSHGE